jgi:hypothetical protein
MQRIEPVGSWDEPGLTGCRLKASRASELFMALQWESTQFRLNGQLVTPAAPESETDDLGTKWAVIYCESVAAIPMRFSLLAGDIVHNLRTALDYLVYQLVRLGKNEPTKRTSWPIFVEKPVGRDLGRYNAAIKGIPKPFRETIDWFQPYQTPTNPLRENLALLAELDNTDKHRLVRPGVAILTKSAATHDVVVSVGAVEPGKELLRRRESIPNSMEFAHYYELAFWEQHVTLMKLSELAETVDGIIEKFSPFFLANA